MPNCNIYVKKADLPILERARKEIGGSISSILLDLIRARLDGPQQGLEANTMRKIRLAGWRKSVITCFVGRWLVGNDERGMRANDDSGAVPWDEYSVAQTQHGRIVVYGCHGSAAGLSSTMEIYDSLEMMRSASDDGIQKYPENIITAAEEAIKVPYVIELDI